MLTATIIRSLLLAAVVAGAFIASLFTTASASSKKSLDLSRSKPENLKKTQQVLTTVSSYE